MNRSFHHKGAAHVGESGLEVQLGLGGCGSSAVHVVRQDGDTPASRDRTSQLQSLIEAPFSQSRWVKGDGDDAVRRGGALAFRVLAQQFSQEPGGRQMTAKLEGLYQYIDQRLVAKRRKRFIEERWMGLAMAADQRSLGR